MKKILLVLLLPVLTVLFPSSVQAQSPSPDQPQSQIQKYFKGKVEKIIEEEKLAQIQDEEEYIQKVQIRREDNNETIDLNIGSEFQPLNSNQRLKKGTTVILAEQKLSDGKLQVVVVDVYRANTIYWLVAGFFLLVLIVARWQGFMSIVGMVISLFVLMNFIIPHILLGENPILISLLGASVIASLSIYLCHGWSIKSHLALFSMMLVLAFVALISQLSVTTAQVVGLGSEEAFFLQFGPTSKINLQGLLLGGILLGALGVLDDICIAQVAVVFELKTLKKEIGFSELYTRALQIGKDHVASLVNTLILAYAGANLPLFLLFTINHQIPAWVTLNSEAILEEVIRTLTGSIGLVMAVPITTFIAVFVASRLSDKSLASLDHATHTHH